MPPVRIPRAQHEIGCGPLNRSRRNARGSGWHRKGYRNNGNMWINIKEGSYGSVHGMDVNENLPLAEFIKRVARGLTPLRDVIYLPRHILSNEPHTHMGRQQCGEYYPHREGWTYDIFFRRTSLIIMMIEFMEQDRDESEDLVRDFFDGGETVIWKVYDEEERERVFTREWEYH